MCTKVSQQRDAESSLNGLEELLRPELTGPRKQQGQERRRLHPFPAGHPLPKQPAWVQTARDGARSEPGRGKEGRGS